MGIVKHEEDNERGLDGLHLKSLINDHLPAYVGGPRFVNSIFLSLADDVFISLNGRGHYAEGGTCNRFLSEERASHSVFLFTPVLWSNVIRINTFSRIGFQSLQVVKRQQVEEFAMRLS